MKHVGDRKVHGNAPTMGGLVQDLADNLSAANDVRFKRFWAYDPIPAFKPWLKNSKRVNVAIGANKSTKTTMGIIKAVCVYTGIVPPALRDCWPDYVKIPRHRPRHVRIIVQDFTKHWPETIRPLLLDEEKWGYLPEAWARNYDPNEHMFYGPDGSYLSIMAINPREVDEEKITNTLRGPLIDHTYIDELQRRAVYTESLTRNATLPDGPATVDLGFCPQEGYDWTYDDFYLTAYDRNDRLLDEPHPFINVVRVGMRDNPSISHETIEVYIATLKPWEVAYRVDGKYSSRAGDPYFDVGQLETWRRKDMFQPGVATIISPRICIPEEGSFWGKLTRIPETDARSHPAVWRVWEKPKNGEYYVATCDTAEGNKDSDYQVADIWRCSEDGNITVTRPVQCAQLHLQRMKPGEFIEEVCCMATVYGECLLVYEVNNTSGGTVRDRSRNYSNLYKRWNSRQEIESGTELLGWYTDLYNKPAALEELYNMLREWPDDFCGMHSPKTLEEMFAYQEKIVRDPKTQVAKRVFGPAGQGMHDDTITTAYILAYVLRFQKDLLTQSVISDRSSGSEGYLSPLEQKAHENDRSVTQLKKQETLLTLYRRTRRNARGH